MNNKQTYILKEIIIMIILSVIIIIIGFLLSISSYDNEVELSKTIFLTYFFIAIAYAIFLPIRILMTIELKKKLPKKIAIAIAIAIVAVIIMAIPSENNSYTECGVGSVYTKHYNNDGYRESSSEGCDVTIGGALKLTGAFILFFYLSLFVLERREKENEIKNKSKKIKKDTDEEIKTKIDDNDYEDIPF